MTRAEIKQQIKSIPNIYKSLLDSEIDELTDLFIELSNERCKEQRDICAAQIVENKESCNFTKYGAILNAPLPKLD